MIKEYIPKYMENRIRSKRWGDWLFFLSGQFSLSLSPPVFSNSIAIIFFFPQINWNNFFSFHFGNNIATNQLLQFFFLQFSATSLPKLLLNFCHNSFFFFFFSSHFWQLGCHNSYFLSPHPFNFSNLVATICFFFFFPPIFSNLVATILIFSLLNPSILATWLPQLVSLFFFFFFPSYFQQLGCHNSYFLSSHSPRILATWLPQFLFSLSSLP